MPDPASNQYVDANKSTWYLKRFVAFVRTISFLPLPVLYVVGTVLGESVYWLSPSRREITRKNLGACFPDWSSGKIRKISRRHFHHMAISAFTIAIAWWASDSRLKRLVNFNNRNHFEHCIKNNQNIILLAPHFTTLEFLGISLMAEFQVSSMFQPHKNRYVNDFMKSRRTRFGSALFSYKGSMTPLIKSIRSGVPFYYLPDQDPGKKKGIFAPFYGIPTATYPALPKLAKLGNAQVIPCMARLKRFGFGFDVIYGNPLDNFPTDDLGADVTAMNQAIEALIEHAPEQYFWSHKRFKTRPDGEHPFY